MSQELISGTEVLVYSAQGNELGRGMIYRAEVNGILVVSYIPNQRSHGLMPKVIRTVPALVKVV